MPIEDERGDVEPRMVGVGHDVEQDLRFDPQTMHVGGRPAGGARQRRIDDAGRVPFDGGDPLLEECRRPVRTSALGGIGA